MPIELIEAVAGINEGNTFRIRSWHFLQLFVSDHVQSWIFSLLQPSGEG
jgi:hypothetical protein